MQKQVRRLIFSGVGIVLLVLGAIVGALWLRPQDDAKAMAALAQMQHGMRKSIVPLRPLTEWAVNMDLKDAQNAQKEVPCLASAAPPMCYSPQQLRTAYGVQPLLNMGLTGKGRIITIVDAFQSPTIRKDLQLFDRMFGLPDPQLNIIAPFGLTPFNPKDAAQVGFAGEISLDVEWAHAMAPEATINLVLANVKQETLQGQLDGLLQVLNFVVEKNMGSVISLSFGASETCLPATFIQQAHRVFQQARAQQQTVFASAGDSGAATLQCDANGNPVALVQGVNYPASDPLVTSVGGTTLLADKNGMFVNESTWNEAQRGAGATGGGISKVFAQPDFQRGIINSARRAVADIALDADPLTGVPVVSGSLMPGKTVVLPIGGTSVGAPVLAGMTALFDQAVGGKRLGFLNSALSRIGQNAAVYQRVLHDVKTGNNTFVFNDNNKALTVPGFAAKVGWDAPTGWGSPNAAQLAAILPQTIKPNDGTNL